MRYKFVLLLLLGFWMYDAKCQHVPKKVTRQIESFFIPVDLSANESTESIPKFSKMVKDKSIVVGMNFLKRQLR